jgi:hypothetical protein
LKNERFQDAKGGGSGQSFWEGFGDQNRPKSDPKTGPNLRRFSSPKKLLFQSLLEPSWADLGAFWRPSWGQQQRSGIGIRSTGAKFTIFMLIGFQDAFWTDLGRSWPPKVPKMTPTWRPKTTKNHPKIDIEKRSNF